jgi:hypothetical protein
VGHKGKLRIHLQDRYKGVSSTGGHWVTPSKQKECQLKVKIVMDADRAGRKLANNRAVWQINHASFSNKRYEPYTTGEIVNRLLRAKRFASPGIVMLDDVDSAICDHVIGHNSAYVS